MKQLVILLFFPFSFICQNQVKGIILDEKNQQPIPYVSIGVIGKSIGTVGDQNGNFIIQVDGINDHDSIKFSSIGFNSLTLSFKDFKKQKSFDIYLTPYIKTLDEVIVKAKKIKYKFVGNTNYSKNNCSGFVKNNHHWKGSESAVYIENKNHQDWLIETFNMYIIKNTYTDSLVFRLMFYQNSNGKPGITFLQKPIIFKIGIKDGEFSLDLKDLNIHTHDDFFVSLECLMNEMDIAKFCYAGSSSTPSFIKPSAFQNWSRIRGGGSDFNLKVSYSNN